jgi:hypothetical protein
MLKVCAPEFLGHCCKPHPGYTDIFEHFNDRMLRTEMIVMTLPYGIFLFLGYLTVKIIIKIPDRMAL